MMICVVIVTFILLYFIASRNIISQEVMHPKSLEYLLGTYDIMNEANTQLHPRGA